MTVQHSPEYESEFPENFNWGKLESPKLERVASSIASRCHGQRLLVASQRHHLGGLREALRIIAETAEIA